MQTAGTLISVGMQNNRTTPGKELDKFLEVKHKLAIQSNNPVPKFTIMQITASGQIQQHQTGPDTFVFVLFLAASDNSGVEHLQQRLYSLRSQYLLKLSIPSQKSLPISVLEKRTSIDTKCRCSEELFIIIKNWNQPKCLSFNRLMDKSAVCYIHTMVF